MPVVGYILCRMGFPLGVSDVWKMFEWANHKKADNKAAVTEWLEAVYSDLNELSEVWIKIASALETADVDGEVAEAFEIINRRSDALSQRMFRERRVQFYESASSVLPLPKKTEFRDSFIEKLGDLLYTLATRLESCLSAAQAHYSLTATSGK